MNIQQWENRIDTAPTMAHLATIKEQWEECQEYHPAEEWPVIYGSLAARRRELKMEGPCHVCGKPRDYAGTDECPHCGDNCPF